MVIVGLNCVWKSQGTIAHVREIEESSRVRGTFGRNPMADRKMTEKNYNPGALFRMVTDMQ